MSTIQDREFRGEALSADALAAAGAVLTATHLPVDDLAAEGVNLFTFQAAGNIVGYGGFERYGENARSLLDRRRSRSAPDADLAGASWKACLRRRENTALSAPIC